MRESVPVDLSGVPATSLSNLARRAAAAHGKKPLLDDPRAVEAVERLDGDLTDVPPEARRGTRCAWRPSTARFAAF